MLKALSFSMFVFVFETSVGSAVGLKMRKNEPAAVGFGGVCGCAYDRGCHQVLTGAETVTIGLGRYTKTCEGSTYCS
jgi:hypothetical protein